MKPSIIQAIGIIALFGGVIAAIAIEGTGVKIACGIVAVVGAITWFYGVSK